MDWRWLAIFVGQLASGFALLYLPSGNEGAATLGIALIGGAFGQGVTAQLKARAD